MPHSCNPVTTSVNEVPGVADCVTGTLKIENISLNVLSENPLDYKSRPLFSVAGESSVGNKCCTTRSMLLDSRATTIYVSKRWVEEHRLQLTTPQRNVGGRDTP
ncbi:unnamed protein product [Phytophthora fragariaefolia]|uniref:Unnamed protein product n=1 Tax=Phytophthora fragariaefolia TaxID=1490495 RepID=A0A9W7DG19_9STRA|nr:unnamed protein product [Phytophthora fragariaefolia]